MLLHVVAEFCGVGAALHRGDVSQHARCRSVLLVAAGVARHLVAGVSHAPLPTVLRGGVADRLHEADVVFWFVTVGSFRYHRVDCSSGPRYCDSDAAFLVSFLFSGPEEVDVPAPEAGSEHAKGDGGARWLLYYEGRGLVGVA